MLNPQTIDSALRLIDRELWVITAASGDIRGGLLATWVSTASIDAERPVLLAGLGPNHRTTELVQETQCFAAHLLRPDQIDLAWNFARDSSRERDKLARLSWKAQATGTPVLADCLAWFDCRVFATYNAGDRLLVWADIVAGEAVGSHLAAGSPLREHEFFRSLTPAQRQVLTANRVADAEKNRPQHESWRNSLHAGGAGNQNCI